MIDLSHWDFASSFNGYDAAALILGIEPSQSMNENAKIQVVTRRLKESYSAAWFYYDAVYDPFNDDRVPLAPLNMLPSEQMLNNVRASENSAICKKSFLTWLADDRSYEFDRQKFTREVLTRWLSANDLKSVYCFTPITSATLNDSENQAGRWPWGNYHTELLGHLEAAFKEHWSTYEPSKPKTAAKAQVVIKWLIERGVSEKMATAIATMIRPDGLPTGPRK
jgi:hypothetical protein